MIVAAELRLALEGRPLLDGISFEVARGESVALVGPNGSGKTSILRCLLGLVPFGGRATIGGHDVVRAPLRARRLLGYVPQKVAFGDATAAEVLTFVARLRRLPRAGVADMLREVGLAPHAEGRVRTFSAGMQQRLAIAVALLADPPVLLLDEPSARLDREGQRMLHRIAGQLRRKGHTLLLASPRPEEVSSLTDRVLHVEHGRLVGSPTPVTRPLRIVSIAARVERR